MGGSSVPRISAPWIFIRVIPISSHDLFKRPHKIQVHPHLHFAIPKGCTPISTREREREGLKKGENEPRRGVKGVRGALLLDVRFEPSGAGEPVPGGFHADLRGPEDPGLTEHRGQAHQPPLPAVQARHHHRRLPALRPRWRYARLCQRQSPACWRTTRPQVQSGISSNT